MKTLLLLFLTLCCFWAKAQNSLPLFRKVHARESGIHFVNKLDEAAYPGITGYINYYNGAGIGAGDLNNDGLVDLYFTSNIGPDKLYINKGKLKFEEISPKAGIQHTGGWKTGVTMADVNSDGYLDIYVCYSGMELPDNRRNKLYINNKNLTFSERAQEYGVNDPGYSTHATFFDYDKDGDLDLYVLNNSTYPNHNINADRKTLDPFVGDKLYQNRNGKFCDVTQAAGISQNAISLGLGVVAGDLNNDGWSDLYVANDFIEPDYIYINNQDGTFTESSQSMLGHMPNTSMGCDLADFNNDGYLDIMSVDMLPEGQDRQKLFLAQDNYEAYHHMVKNGLHHQYIRNMLQLNNGDGTFSEIGQLAGVYNTDWSWAALFADFNNDGFKDLLITNGFVRDITNRDYLKYSNTKFSGRKVTEAEFKDVLKKAPATKLRNYMFQNNKDLTFSDKSLTWGLKDSAFSNGAIYADLDNDGDLDLAVSNINDPAFLYENRGAAVEKNSWVQVQLTPYSGKPSYGTRVYVYHRENIQVLEYTASRGFQSSMNDVMHFGLGKDPAADSVKVVWPDGSFEVKAKVRANHKITFRADQAKGTVPFSKNKPLFSPVKSPFSSRHYEGEENDFKRQYLLTAMFSKLGPRFQASDINNDGQIDYFVYGSEHSLGSFYVQQNGQFTERPLSTDSISARVAAAHFFDADGDGDQDLYLAMGGYGFLEPQDASLQDRLYIQEPSGFIWNQDALPKVTGSKACVTVLDFNKDHKPDLFVGGRVVPGAYPSMPRSFLLQNNGNGSFLDATNDVCPELGEAGMITDAVVVDIDGDQQPELVTVGEWMDIEVWKSDGRRMYNDRRRHFDSSFKGWWNTIRAIDVDSDGDTDLIAGNLGLNTQIKASRENPVAMIYADFDGNQAIDPILCYTTEGKTYPYILRDELLDQIFNKRSKFTSYSSYAKAALNEVFSQAELTKSKRLTADWLRTTLFINEHGKFHMSPLPVEAQLAPVHTITPLDVNNDNKQDLLLMGNNTHYKLRLGKADANYGVLLLNNGHGFTYVPQFQSGVCIKGDVRDAVYNEMDKTLLIGINNDELKAYQLK